jgi:UPF0176 protein
MTYTVAAFYRFVPVADGAALRSSLLTLFVELGLCGTLLLAPEGINGTMAGSKEAVESLLSILHETFGLTRNEVKFSEAPEKPFNRLKIRLKKEIITFKQPQANPNELKGVYVSPHEWNDLMKDPDVLVLDTRNVYETVIGTFKSAVDPQIQNFTEFADYVRTHLASAKNKKIAMYCTGGIRCEKASAFMRAEGFPEVYHLKGGILKYLEEVPADESQWQGDCYVFDRRMAVGHGLTTGRYSMCFCCGYALSDEDKKHPSYEDGVSCAYCYSWSSAKDKARFRMRHKQMMQRETLGNKETLIEECSAP